PKIAKNYFLLELKGKGKYQLNMTNFVHEGILKGKIVAENNIKHLKFEKVKMKIGYASATIVLDNLFNGDPVLGKGANDAINDNIGVFFDELRPHFEELLSNTFTNIANNITEKFDYDDLFPKSS
ncbi:hypothetical protein ILUMI_17389, partial [Ignelater luminosus]